MEIYRKIFFYRNYFHDFFDELSEEVKNKIDYVLYVVTVAEQIPSKFFKKVEVADGIFEIRVEYESNIYRIFCCFDDGKLIILFNGFQKKTQKTPQKEIDKALELRKMYYNEKYYGKTK